MLLCHRARVYLLRAYFLSFFLLSKSTFASLTTQVLLQPLTYKMVNFYKFHHGKKLRKIISVNRFQRLPYLMCTLDIQLVHLWALLPLVHSGVNLKAFTFEYKILAFLLVTSFQYHDFDCLAPFDLKFVIIVKSKQLSTMRF